MIYIGIDPGDRGAMVAIDADGRLVASLTADSRGGEVGYYVDGDPDPLAVTAWINAFRDRGVARVTIETPFAPGRIGTANAITIGRRWGIHYAAVRASRVPVVLVTPAKWSADLFGGKKGKDGKEKKAVGVRLVGERIPDLRLVLPGCRVAHDGLSDAACIAIASQLRGVLR